jgi:hypothetical protein
MSEQYRVTAVLSLAGEYGEGRGTPLEISTFRRFDVTEIEPTAKTFELSVSGFSTQVPLLPKGWEDNQCWVVIHNKTGMNRQTYPTDVEKRAESIADVLIGTELNRELIRIRSGMLSCFEPACGEKFYLYAPNTPAICRVTYFPIR